MELARLAAAVLVLLSSSVFVFVTTPSESTLLCFVLMGKDFDIGLSCERTRIRRVQIKFGDIDLPAKE